MREGGVSDNTRILRGELRKGFEAIAATDRQTSWLAGWLAGTMVKQADSNPNQIRAVLEIQSIG